MELDHKKIAEAISNPIFCKQSQEAITNILKCFGYEPDKVPKRREPKIGEVWSVSNNPAAHWLIISSKDKNGFYHYLYLNKDSKDNTVKGTGSFSGNELYCKYETFTDYLKAENCI